MNNYSFHRLFLFFICLPLFGLGQEVNVTTYAGGTFHDSPALEAKFFQTLGTAVDAAGNVYVADAGNHRIRKISTTGIVSTIAGTGVAGYADGAGNVAKFNYPTGVAVDRTGNLYVADNQNQRIRKINTSGVVSTLAGSGFRGFSNGTGTAASFRYPFGIAVDASGNVYVADRSNHSIRKITTARVVSTFAGTGNIGVTNGTGTDASFNEPAGIAIDTSGNLIIADRQNHRIRKISPTRVVTTIAGSGLTGEGNGSFLNGDLATSRFSIPTAVAVDRAGNIFVAEEHNRRVRKITPAGVVSTLAGSGSQTFANGTGTSASFSQPMGISIDALGNLYLADMSEHRIRKITTTGVVTTFAGTGTFSFADGTGTIVSFNRPSGVAVDRNGDVFVADLSNNRIRKINPSGVVSTFAGSGAATNVNGIGTAASFGQPRDLAIDSIGNIYVAASRLIRKINASGLVTTLATLSNIIIGIDVDRVGNVYAAIWDEHRIVKITPAGVVSTLAGSAGTAGYVNATGSEARFNRPRDVAVDGSGNVFVVDGYNHRIRKISPLGVVTAFVGSGISTFADGTGTDASFSYPKGITIDASGFLYVTDSYNNRIRKISPAGVVTTLAGTGDQVFADGTGTTAAFSQPDNVAIDSEGNVYVAEANSLRIRKIIQAGCATPVISGTATICAGMSSVLTSTSASGYIWSTGANTQSITVTTSGTYTVRTIEGTCTSANATFAVTVNECGPLFIGSGSYSIASNWANNTVPIPGSNITVAGNMTVNSGVSYANITVLAGGIINITNGTTLTATGNLSNANTIIGEGTLLLAGANNQTFGGGIIENLLVNNSATVVQSAVTQISGSVTLGSNQVLNLNNQQLILLSTSIKTASLANVPSNSSITNATNFTVQRWLNNNLIRNGASSTGNYYFLGPVVQGQTVNLWNAVSPYNNQTFTGTGVGNLYLYNPIANNWYKPSSSSTALPVGAGIQVWFGASTFFGTRNAWSVTGVPQVGNYNLPITPNQGFQLLSNPYPSTIDWDSPNWTKTNVANAIYIYDWVNRRYKSYINGLSINGGSRYLPTAQGFIVRANNNAPVLTAREGIKVSNQVAMQRIESQVNSIIRLQVQSDLMIDEVLIANRPNTQLAFEPEFDAEKMMNPANNIFIGGTVPQSIASMDLNEATVIPIVLLSNSSGSVTLSTAEFSGLSGGPYYLVDEVTTEVYPYTPQTNYQFFLNANQPYSLSLRLNNVTGINTFKVNAFEIYPNPATNKVTIQTNGTGNLEILNAIGQVVFNQRAIGTNEINISKLAMGVYTVRFNGVSQKLVVR